MTQEEPENGGTPLDDIAERYLEELGSGKEPDLAALCAAHPRLAGALERRLSTLELLVRVGREMRGDETRTQAAESNVRCPHCGHAVPVRAPAAGALSCPECGSNFRVDAPAGPGDPSVDAPERIGRFHVLVPLGRGAFGTVYQAHDADLDRMVAIKVPRVGLFQTEEDAERFLREARSAARLRHPGIVQVHEIGHERGIPYIVSDYIESRTLAEIIAADRPSFHEAAALVARIADALEYAHAQKVIHRDVKPQNILIDPAGNPHVSDFGLARREGEDEVTVTMDGQILGTPAYMSPEQAAGDHSRVNARSDVYSLGVLFYELLSGERPFRGSRSRVIYQVIHDEPRTPRSLNDHIPRDLDTICMKAMAKEPARRYAGAADFAEDLHRFLRGEAILARPVSTTERFWRWTRRNRRLSAALLGLFIILATGLAVSLVLLRRVSEETHAKGEALRGKDHALTTLQSALSRAEGLRLTALSSNLLSSDPALALLLAIEGAERHPDLAARNAVLDALSGLHERRTLRGHAGAVLNAAFSPDGRHVVTASADGDARLWSAADGSPVAILKGHVHEMPVVLFSGDGRVILTASSDGTLRLWDASTARQLAAFSTGWNRPECVELGRDGRRVLLVARGASIWDVAGRRAVAVLGDATIACAAFSRDETKVATGSRDGKVRIHESSSGKASAVLEGHGKEIRWVRFAPADDAGDERVASFAADGSVRLWDIASSKCARIFEGPPAVEAAAVDAGGRRLATFSRGPAFVRDLSTGEQISILAGQDGPVACAAFSLDGRRLAGVPAHQDKTVRVWDVESGRQVAFLGGHQQSIRSVAFAPDGESLASASLDGSARLWRVARDAGPIAIGGHAGPVLSAAFSNDGRRLVTASLDGTAGIWEATTGKRLLSLEAPGGVQAALFSPDDRQVVTAGGEGLARVWEVDSGEQRAVLRGHAGAILAARFSSDGRVITAGADGTARIWDAASGKEVLALAPQGSPVHAAFLSADGLRLLTRPEVGPARLWDAVTGAEAASLRHMLVPEVSCAAFSSDGRRIITASSDRTARIWDGSSGKQVSILRGHEGRVSSAAFDPDGRRIVTASADRTARIWAGPEMYAVLSGHDGEVNAAAFSPDGRWVVTGSRDRTARLWSVETGLEEVTFRDHEAEVIAVAFSPDGRRVLALPAEGPPRLWPADVLAPARARRPRAFTPEEVDLYEVSSAEGRRSYRLDMKIEEHRVLLDLLERRARTEPGMWPAPWDFLDGLFEIIALLPDGGSEKHVSAARELAGWWVEKTGGKEPRALLAMSDLEKLAGRTGEAILALEEATRLPSVTQALKMKLADLRSAARPDLLTYASIDAFLGERDWEALVPQGAPWRFFPGRAEPSPGLEWTSPGFDDSSWEEGPTGLGYGDEDDATILEGMQGSYSTLYARHRFRIDRIDRYKRFLLSVLADDGFVAYLNGVEVGRDKAEPPGEPLPHHAVAKSEGSEGQPIELWVEAYLFREGENILAVQGLNVTIDSADFSLIPVLVSELVPEPAKERPVLAAFRSAARAKNAAHRLAYLDGKLLALAGDHRAAAVRFAAAARIEKVRAEPALALARSLEAAGDIQAAEAAVRGALEARLTPRDDLWDLWFTLNLLRWKRSPAEALRALPSAAADDRRPDRGADIRWVLEELMSRGILRINCGGPEYRSPTGAVWSHDRFFTSGYRFVGDRRLGGALEPFTDEITGTDDDTIYQTERWFPLEEVTAQYRVPLPPGRYKVALHFAEIYLHPPAERIFTIVLEETSVAPAYKTLEKGFAAADRRAFEVEVKDGFLDILFVPHADLPKISALEVEGMGSETASGG